MKKFKLSIINLVSIVLFFVGISLLIYTVLKGESTAGLVLIFPFIYSNTILATIGIFCIIVSIILPFFLSSEWSLDSQDDGEEPFVSGTKNDAPKKKSSYGGMLLIGPIPIIFGSDKRMTYIAAGIGLAIVVVVLLIIIVLK